MSKEFLPTVYQATEFDGKRLRKAIARKTVDYNSSIINMLETRIVAKNHHDRRAIQPDYGYYPLLLPPMSFGDNPVNCVTTKFVRASTNKMRCPIFCTIWTPEGRRLVTGASSGEFTLWNGLTFNFETILQAHDSAVRAMVWSMDDLWMVTADQSGNIKYWQSNMNNVKMFHGHESPIRGLSMSPSGADFATCSDDGTIKIWDFLSCKEERTLRGHGSDVKAIDWHPDSDLIVSGSKDSQQPVKLWDPRVGTNLATLHAHKNTVMDVKWNQNGNWLLTASRDHLIKIFDIRNIKTEMQVFRGHKKEACCLTWHPIDESLFASGGSDGSILFWEVGVDKEIGVIESAHESVVWSLSWHPLGHILASGSNDHSCKFWTRNRPGDRMVDKYNLNEKTQESKYCDEMKLSDSIPGISKEKSEDIFPEMVFDKSPVEIFPPVESKLAEEGEQQRKVPFSKPIPKDFADQWSEKTSQPVTLPPCEMDEQYNPDHHHHHHMDLNYNLPPNRSPYIHGPPMRRPYQYPPDPPPMPPHMRRGDMHRGDYDFHFYNHPEDNSFGNFHGFSGHLAHKKRHFSNRK
ncbi:pre-mRNA 3' end processing protein WDR33-like [Panonychus citri]|uniref:pre-mRNA 3' end processing protein WDR33-like n=1 Tax=Panonychus citri TaxID=50023 RepID=UPI0023072332|nr:pre-mRNA 3' end processing protein WDR33-like [Panonychus citri]XP_053214364.1 pre-mRNA 3' end processing protein WDR33-like [Panonychus citri]